MCENFSATEISDPTAAKGVKGKDETGRAEDGRKGKGGRAVERREGKDRPGWVDLSRVSRDALA